MRSFAIDLVEAFVLREDKKGFTLAELLIVVAINKTGNKITSIAVANAKFESVQSGWAAGSADNLPNGVDWNGVIADGNGGTADDYTVTFTYADDGVITATATK